MNDSIAKLSPTSVDWRDWIATDPSVIAGKPCIKGTRISVALLLDRLNHGWSHQDILAAYPHLTTEQIDAAVRFTAEYSRRIGE